ncbi:uncharacterized protein LOC119080606 [Bradysia coprophila]|uniref:uncharacterized protein LOC119080606 n=1 Tax=Bradysia coprophila TaxID=38358 RepID=UPI00187D8857|nr:uncharacterized protein LOC119080606 [Bradysia coprophila]
MLSAQHHHLVPFGLISPDGNVERNKENESKIIMEEEQSMTHSELEAKSFVVNMIKNGTSTPCDVPSNSGTISATLPRWYDELKFKRGQKYFLENRFGILSSNLCGLLILLADPKGLDVLDSTKRSSTVETAKKRYVSTIMHTISWYEIDLRPGSKSWESLNTIRKMHLLASNSASKKMIGLITQSDLVLTTFGFMGLALVRPHFLGIRCDNKEDREGFTHFWAVIGHMLGVEDHFNMCLFSLETIEHICSILIRYFFIPVIQLETVKFKEMTNVLLNGLSPFMPHMSYDIQLFLVKRIIGVPGHQYGVDVSKEVICRSIFSADELDMARKVVRSMHRENSHYLQMYEIFFNDGIPVAGQSNLKSVKSSVKSEHGNSIEIYGKTFHWIMKSNDGAEWREYLNDAAFYALSKRDQLMVRWICFLFWCYGNLRLAKYVCEWGMNLILFLMQRFDKSL